MIKLLKHTNVKASRLSIFCLLLLLLLPYSTQAQLAETTFKLNDLLGADVTLSGRNSEAIIFVPLQSDWEIDAPLQVKFFYTASPLLSSERTTVTIQVNGTAITSFRPVIDGLEHQAVIEIPPNLLEPPGIELQIVGLLSLEGEFACEELFNVGQWLTISKASEFVVHPTPRISTPDLSDLPTAIVMQGAVKNPPPVVFVLPENPNSVVLTTAAQIAARLGTSTRGYHLPFRAATPDSLTPYQRENANLVVVGTLENQMFITELLDVMPAPPAEGQFVTADGAPIPPEHGAVQIFTSPWNEARNILVVSANGEAGLRLAGQAFLDTGAFSTMEGAFTFIRELVSRPAPLPGTPWLEANTTFSQFGLGDREVRGVSVSNTTYTFRRPPGWVFEEGSRLMLHLGFSPTLRTADVFLDVFLNDRHIGTVNIQESDIDTWTAFDLPVDALNHDALGRRSQTFSIRLEVSDEFLPTNTCERRVIPWMTIYNDSFFHVEHAYDELPDLQIFPYPFVSDQGAKPTVIVVPDQPTRYEIESALALAATFGNFTLRDLHLTVATTDQVQQSQLSSSHVIILGIYDRQPFITEVVQEQASIPEIGIYQSRDIPNIGLIREVTSPWNPSHVALLIYGERSLELVRAADVLFLAAPPVSQPGSAAVVDESGEPRIVYREVEKPFAPDVAVEAATSTPDSAASAVAEVSTPTPTAAVFQAATAAETATSTPQRTPSRTPTLIPPVTDVENGDTQPLSGSVPTEIIVGIFAVMAIAALGRILLRPNA